MYLMESFMDSLAGRHKEMLAELESLLGYRFTDLRLLQAALVHSSYAFEQNQGGNDNQVLEFIGDAVLDLVIGHALSLRYPEMKEGELTRFRASLVNKSSILSCAFEAVIGAIFKDSGYQTVDGLVLRLFEAAIEQKKQDLLLMDAKSRLQEHLQERFNEAPVYRLDGEDGPAHRRQFSVSVIFQDEVLGSGAGGSKKEAEQRAAQAALEPLLQGDDSRF
jgi:ribonuclease-3